MAKKFIFKCTVIICIILAFITKMAPYFVNPGHTEQLYQGLYNKDSSYDVLFMGSSHMNGMMDPSVLYDKYGITSFNYATGGQPVNVTYYLLKEALKVQHPKIVVLDLYYFGLTDKYGDEGYIRYVLDNLKLSKNKLDAIQNCVPKDQRIEYLFPFIKYHERWSTLTESDFAIDVKFNPSLTGYGAGTNHYGKAIEEYQHGTETGTLPSESEKYLKEFIELSKEYNFKLIFTNAPYDYASDNTDCWYTDDSVLYNTIEKIADENNIPFINYSTKEVMNEIDFDFPNDMNNVGHTNVYGAEKVSNYFADFLNKNYTLEDHRK